jgi:hypothetical protein
MAILQTLNVSCILKTHREHFHFYDHPRRRRRLCHNQQLKKYGRRRNY